VRGGARIYQAVLADARAAPATGGLPGIVLPEQGQLDIASQLYAQSAHSDAATAYELLLDRYPACRKAHEVRLILGLLYTRHLAQPDRARELIEQARPGLHQESLANLADQLLAELSA
jgi:hypothetical protein